MESETILDCEQMKALTQKITCIEIVQTYGRDDLPGIDTEILNKAKHDETLIRD